MSRPLLQLALDHSSLEDAQRDVTLLKDSVDIVEAGTILCLNEGLGAVKALREQCPDKIIVADWKVADAGEKLHDHIADIIPVSGKHRHERAEVEQHIEKAGHVARALDA